MMKWRAAALTSLLVGLCLACAAPLSKSELRASLPPPALPHAEVVEPYLNEHVAGRSTGQAFCAHRLLGSESSSPDQLKLYLWVICQEYITFEDHLRTQEGGSFPVLVRLAQEAGVWRVVSHREPRDHPSDIEQFFPGEMVARQDRGREAVAGGLGLDTRAVKTTRLPLHRGIDWNFSNGHRAETVASEPYRLERSGEIAGQTWTLSSAAGPRSEEGRPHLCARLEITIPDRPSIVDQTCALTFDRLQPLSLGYLDVGNEPRLWAYGFTSRRALVEAVFDDKSKDEWIQKNGFWVGFFPVSKDLRELWTVIEGRRADGCGGLGKGSCI